MNILISAPALDARQNVSGISSVVKTIMESNPSHQYVHLRLGSRDVGENRFRAILSLIWKLVRFPLILRRHRIDMVHLNLPFNRRGILRDYWFHLFSRLCRVPVFLHIHGGAYLMQGVDSKIAQWMTASMFGSSSLVVVLSELEKKVLEEQHHYQMARVLPNAVNSSVFRIGQNRPESLPTLLFMGRIHESKGILPLIEALRMLRQEVSFRLLLCGTGPLKDKMVADCEALLGADFEYRGVLSGDDKVSAIMESEIFLLPSLYGEGLPVALLEAMAGGLVPVVTDDGSMTEVVHSGVNGVVVEKNDAAILAFELRRLIEDHKLLKKLSEKAVECIAARFDISINILRLNELYKEAMPN